MTLVQDRTRDTAARWRAGPGIDALSVLLGEPPLRTHLERVHFRRKGPVHLVYGATMHSGLVLPVLAEFCPGETADRAAQSTASLRKSRNGQGPALSQSPVVADATSGMVLRRPGLDERIPGLRILHEADFARETVAGLTGRDPGTVSTRLVAHRLGQRAVVRIDSGASRFYARIRAIKSAQSETRLARHKAIWDALGPTSPLAIPEPLGSRADLGLALFGELDGSPPDFSRDQGAVARSIAALRSLAVEGLPGHSGADEADLLRDWLKRCQIHMPEVFDRIAPLVSRTCDALVSTSGVMLPCHRDLHEKQILVRGGRAGFLDFDTLSLADPALDPGNLLAHLFFAGQDERPLSDRFDLRGIGLWRRAALLRLAMIYSFTSTPGAAIRRLIDEASR